jgi:hypothetical protein
MVKRDRDQLGDLLPELAGSDRLDAIEEAPGFERALGELEQQIRIRQLQREC